MKSLVLISLLTVAGIITLPQYAERDSRGESRESYLQEAVQSFHRARFKDSLLRMGKPFETGRPILITIK